MDLGRSASSHRCCGGSTVRPECAIRLARVRDLGDCWIEQPLRLEGALEEIAGFYRTMVVPG